MTAPRMTTPRGTPVKKSVLAASAAAVALVSVTACGSSASTGASAPASSAPASSSAAPAAAKPAPLTSPDQKKIAANWTTFFNPKSPQALRLALLQNASSFGTALAAMSKNPQSATSTAKVESVTVTSSSAAKVTYDILVSGTPALTNQAGEAVKENGTWKVSVKSFCALLAMQSGGKTSALPPACKG